MMGELTNMPKYVDINHEIQEMQQVIDEHKNSHTFENEIASYAFKLMIEKFQSLPPADVAPVIHAKWIPVTNGRGGHECSLCHSYAPSFMTGDEWLTDYCPNCGVKMDERG